MQNKLLGTAIFLVLGAGSAIIVNSESHHVVPRAASVTDVEPSSVTVRQIPAIAQHNQPAWPSGTVTTSYIDLHSVTSPSALKFPEIERSENLVKLKRGFDGWIMLADANDAKNFLKDVGLEAGLLDRHGDFELASSKRDSAGNYGR